MPPIPLHLDDPITPGKASGATPQKVGDEPTRTNSANATPNTTAAAAPCSYPAAQPAAPPAPGPTPFIARIAPQPSRTENSSADSGPPPPQPGAVPTPPSAATTGAYAPPASTQGTAFTSYLNHLHAQPSPIENQAPTHSTSTLPPSAPSRQGPTTLNLGPANTATSAGPPGYTQNAYAQELSPAQRASLDAQSVEERRGSWVDTLGAGGQGGAGEAVGGAWGTVKAWGMGVAGKAAELEGELWRRMDGGEK